MTGRGAAAITCAILLAATALVPAHAAPSRSQTFFRSQVLSDNATSDEIVDLLRSGGFVDRKIAYDDLTGDGRQDAVVRVTTGGAAGIVAIYVFSTHGRESGEPLRVVFRRQRLVRASTRIRRHRLSYRTRAYAAGDELCCPSATAEYRVTWDDEARRFRAGRPRDVS